MNRTGSATAVVGLILLAGCQPGGEPTGSPPAAIPTGIPPVSGAPATTGAPTTTAAAPGVASGPTGGPTPTSARTATSPPGTPSARPIALREGDSGPGVLALQRRLVSLGFWLGSPDGRYGSGTAHAVTAFQKAAGLARDGVAGPVTMAALDRASRPRARSKAGRVVEVDLRRQLLLVAVDGRVRWVLDASTGRVAGTTPTGHYTVTRQVNGYDSGPLGVLYRPKYFVGGVAVHGFPSVPPYPASHGCVRVANAAMDWLWASGALPVGGPVWVY